MKDQLKQWILDGLLYGQLDVKELEEMDGSSDYLSFFKDFIWINRGYVLQLTRECIQESLETWKEMLSNVNTQDFEYNIIKNGAESSFDINSKDVLYTKNDCAASPEHPHSK